MEVSAPADESGEYYVEIEAVAESYSEERGSRKPNTENEDTTSPFGPGFTEGAVDILFVTALFALRRSD